MTEGRKLNISLLAGSLGLRGSTIDARNLGRSLLQRGHAVEVLCAGGSMVPDFEKAQVPVVIVESLRDGHLDFWVTRRVAARLRTSQAHLLHVQSPEVANLGARVATRVKLPYFLTIQTLLDPAAPLPYARKWLRAILAVNETIREHLVNEMKIPKALIRVVTPGTDLDRIRETPPFAGEGSPVIGSLGPLEPGSGHDVFLLAAKELLDAGQEAQFLVLGEGAAGDDLRKLAGDLGITKNVVFLPDAAKYYSILSTVDVLVLPATNAGLSTTLLAEGMAYGKPTIVSAVGEVYQFVREGETGCLVPKGEPGAIRDRIRGFLAAPMEARAMGARARRQVEDSRSLETMAQETLDLYAASLTPSAPA